MWSTIGRTLGVASVRAAAVAPSVSATPRALASVLGPCSSSLRTSYIQAAVAQGFVVRRAYAAAASARARKPAAKKTTARKPAAKKTAARKPAAKKKATAKKPTKKAAGRTKPTAAAKKRAAAAKKRATAAKKKKAAKKAAPKKKKESPEKREHRRKMLLYRKLREHALVVEPKYLPENPYIVFSGEMRQNPENKNKTITEWAKEVGKAYNELSEEKKNRLRGLAAANAATNALAHKRWVESHSPLQILMANRARAILKRRFPGRLRKKLHAAIKDERLPPRPRSPWVQYIISRHQNKTAPESDKANLGSTFKTMAVDWKALSSAEKKPFEDLTAAEIVKYQAFAKDVKL